MRNRSLSIHTGILCAVLAIASGISRGEGPVGSPHLGVSHTRPPGADQSTLGPRPGITPLPPITSAAVNSQTTACPAGHPLRPAIELAQHCLRHASGLRDYSCTLVKRERINGQLTDHEYVFMKIRTRPFSVYTCSLGPQQPRGQECIYVAGRNDGRVLTHGTGWLDRFTGTRSLEPTHAWLLEANLYPITSTGLHNLLHKLSKLHEYESQFAEVSVQMIPNAAVDERLCTCVAVTHPEQRQTFKFHQMRIYYDNEHRLPIRFEAYSWPNSADEEPPLAEEYTYSQLKLNPGLTDADFDVRNPAYSYPEASSSKVTGGLTEAR